MPEATTTRVKTYPCPICQRDTTTLRMPRTNHVTKCAKEHGVEVPVEDYSKFVVTAEAQPAPAPVAPPPVTVQPAAPVAAAAPTEEPKPPVVAPVQEPPAPTAKPESKQTVAPKLRPDVDAALKARELRLAQLRAAKNAPNAALANALLGENDLDSRAALAKRMGLIGDHEYAFWGYKDQYQNYIQSGYRPVQIGDNQDVVGDLCLFAQDKEIQSAADEAAARLSRTRLGEKWQQAQKEPEVVPTR